MIPEKNKILLGHNKKKKSVAQDNMEATRDHFVQ